MFFCAAKWLPATDIGVESKAAAAGYTNLLWPLVALLLIGGLAAGLVMGKEAGGLPKRIAETAEPVAYWRWHLAAACLISVLQVCLFPIWSKEANYFGVRVALMADHKLPYVDFEYAYGYAVAYLPYWLHALGLSIGRALAATLALATVAGVLSVGVLLRAAIARPAMRLTLFWTLVVVGVVVDPGPSLNYNLGRYASPFALLLLLVRFAPRLGAIALFAAVAAANTLVYFISPEMGAAFSAAILAWLALGWRALPRLKLIAIAAGLIASGVGLAVFAGPMFATLFDYSQAQILMPVVPNVIMLLYGVCLPILCGVGLRSAFTVWRGEDVAVALAPAVVGRSWPTITIAYSFATIVMAAGLLAAAGRTRASWVVVGVFVVFVGHSAIDGVMSTWPAALHIGPHRHRGLQAAHPGGQRARPDDDDTATWLNQTFKGAYDPLAVVGHRHPTVVNLGHYIGMEDLATHDTLNKKRQEFQHAQIYILPPNDARATRFEAPMDSASLDGFERAGLYPFPISVRPDTTPSLKAQIVSAFFTQCHPIATHGALVVCTHQTGP